MYKLLIVNFCKYIEECKDVDMSCEDEIQRVDCYNDRYEIMCCQSCERMNSGIKGMTTCLQNCLKLVTNVVGHFVIIFNFVNNNIFICT